MKIKITEIALLHDGKRYEIGDTVATGDKKGQLTVEVAQARLDAGTAELVEADKALADKAQDGKAADGKDAAA